MPTHANGPSIFSNTSGQHWARRNWSDKPLRKQHPPESPTGYGPEMQAQFEAEVARYTARDVVCDTYAAQHFRRHPNSVDVWLLTTGNKWRSAVRKYNEKHGPPP